VTTDPLLEELRFVYEGYLFTRRRYPLLVEIYEEARRLEAIALRKEGRSFAWDHPVLHMVRDTYDMLVIHAASIRERMKTGLFEQLKRNPSRLRPATVAEFDIDRPGYYGDGTPEEIATRKREFARAQAKAEKRQVNEARKHLVGTVTPATRATVTAMVKRFEKETKPLDDHRNRVSAHAYERGVDLRFFLPLPELKQQLDILERYIRDLRTVVARTGTTFDLRYGNSDEETAAEDLADVMVHGSVARAILAYGVTQRDDRQTWFWWQRRSYIALDPVIATLRRPLELLATLIHSRARVE
jgi:hypothetical protein